MSPAMNTTGEQKVDELTFKPLWICWSLSTSVQPMCNLEMSVRSMEIVRHEAILWHVREQEAEKYGKFLKDVSA